MRKFNIIIFSLVFIMLFLNINQSLALDDSSEIRFSNISLGKYKYVVDEENETTPKFEDVKKDLLNQLYKDHNEIYVGNSKKADDIKTEMIVSSKIIFPPEEVGMYNQQKDYENEQKKQNKDYNANEQEIYYINVITDENILIQPINELTLPEIRDLYKCNYIDGNGDLNVGELLQNNYIWKVYFKVKCGLRYIGDEYVLDVTATDIATDPTKLTINSEDFSEPDHEEDSGIVENANKLNEMYNDFKQDALATLEKWFWNVLRTLCDWIQGLLDGLKNNEDGFSLTEDFKIMYSFSSLNSEEGISSEFRNNYTKVAEENTKKDVETTTDTSNETDTSNKTDTWQKQITINNKHEKFTKDKTNIPVITVEPYNIARGAISFFDINFLAPNKEKHGNLWNKLRDLATGFMRITLYFSIIALLTILIIYGIRIVYNSSDSFNIQEKPQELVNLKEGIKRYAISLSLIIGIIVFMALCIYLCDWAVEILKIGNPDDLESDEFPIRVTVENVYSFSTNPIGYYRFMALSDDVADARMYSFIYVISVLINCCLVVIMIVRIFQVYILGIIGPVIIAMYTIKIGNSSQVRLQTWAMKFFMYSSVQVIIAIFYKLLEQVAIK